MQNSVLFMKPRKQFITKNFLHRWILTDDEKC